MFPKVKNVNVESLKNGSKLLDFLWFAGVTSRVASPPIAISCFTFLTFDTFDTFVTFVTFVANVTYDSLHSRDSRSKFHSRDSCSKTKCKVCVPLRV